MLYKALLVTDVWAGIFNLLSLVKGDEVWIFYFHFDLVYNR